VTDGRRSQHGVPFAVLLVVVVGALCLLLLPNLAGAPADSVGHERVGAPVALDLPAGSSAAASVQDVPPEPVETVAGTPVNVSWEAYTITGARAVTYAVICDLSVTFANGGPGNIWVNSSMTGPLALDSNGSYLVPSPAWDAGVLRLTVDLGKSSPVTVQLSGPYLPDTPGPISLTVLPDVEHLVLSDPQWWNASNNASWSTSALWLVRDRFGDPAPGATLIVEFETGTATEQSFVPAVWARGGVTVAWVNCSAANGTAGTVTVHDGAGDLLWGPTGVPAFASGGATAATEVVSPFTLAVVVLLVVGALAGIVALLSGTRARRPSAGAEGEEDLRRLAEGRAAVVEIVREGGPLELREIEARWEPPPAPPAVADWVASLVTDGTLTATLGEGGRARFTLARPPPAEPRVTLDADALEDGLARRDAAVDATDDRTGR